MGMGMNHCEWEGIGLKRTFPHTSIVTRVILAVAALGFVLNSTRGFVAVRKSVPRPCTYVDRRTYRSFLARRCDVSTGSMSPSDSPCIVCVTNHRRGGTCSQKFRL